MYNIFEQVSMSCLEQDPTIFLGVSYAYDSAQVSLPGIQLQKLTTSAQKVLHGTTTTLGAIREFLSRLIYASRILRIPLALYFAVFKFARRRFSVLASAPNSTSTTVWPSVIREWNEWLQLVQKNKPVTHPLSQKNPTFILFTDASLHGAGALLFNVEQGWVKEFSTKWHETFCSNSINELEATAVFLAASHFRDDLSGAAAILLVVDNTSCQYALKKGSSSSFLLNKEVKNALGSLPAGSDIRIAYIQSKANPADGPSRGINFSLGELSSACGLVAEDWPKQSSLRVSVASGRCLKSTR